MTTFNQNVNLEKYLKELPPGLERAVLRVLQPRVGRANVISRAELVANVHYLGFSASDRQVRAVINGLRKQGHLICSTGGVNGGYWLAANRKEVQEYLNNEVRPRAMDLLETESALKKGADDRWGPVQPSFLDQLAME